MFFVRRNKATSRSIVLNTLPLANDKMLHPDLVL